MSQKQKCLQTTGLDLIFTITQLVHYLTRTLEEELLVMRRQCVIEQKVISQKSINPTEAHLVGTKIDLKAW